MIEKSYLLLIPFWDNLWSYALVGGFVASVYFIGKEAHKKKCPCGNRTNGTDAKGNPLCKDCHNKLQELHEDPENFYDA